MATTIQDETYSSSTSIVPDYLPKILQIMILINRSSQLKRKEVKISFMLLKIL